MTEIYDLENTDTICAVSTPPGRGGIAVIRVSGPEAIGVAGKLWRGKDLRTVASHTVHLGNLMDGDDILDEAVATVFRAPRSFTGDDVVELAVHGSAYIQQRLIRLLTSGSPKCRVALPGEFARRAYLAGKMDLARAEAVADVINAASTGEHRLAMSQMRGKLSADIDGLRDRLVELASLLELEMDFSEEDVEFAPRENLITLCREILATLSRLDKSYATGRAIVEGLPVVIAGAPNAGKSTLLNNLLDDDKAIVSDIPGTTRDVIEDTVEIDGVLFRFIDTAGLRDTPADAVEEIGISRAKDRISRAAVVLYLIDASEDSKPALSDFAGLVSSMEGKEIAFIPIINKSDIAAPAVTDALVRAIDGMEKGFTGIEISAPLIYSNNVAGDIERLQKRLLEVAAPFIATTGSSDAILTNERHHKSVVEALAALEETLSGLEHGLGIDLVAQSLRRAIASLSSITGSITTPDLLTTIFSRFCVGK